ncbi:MAG: SpoIIE family protein phosphatase [Planctomycetota bacterium]
MRRRFSIRLLAPLLLMLPVVIVSGVILSVASVSAGRAAERMAFEELSQIRSTVTGRVDELLQTPVRVVSLNRQLLAIGKLDAAEPAGWRETLLAQSATFPSLSAITWGAEDGAATWIARYGHGGEKRYYALLEPGDAGQMREFAIADTGEVEAKPANTFTFDPRGRPWYRAAVEAGGAAWSEPYAWAGDAGGEAVTLGLSHSAPYTASNGEVRGVLSADLNLNDISAYLSDMRIGETGFCFMIDTDGRLIACSTTTVLTGEDDALIRAEDSDEPVVAAVAKGWSLPSIKADGSRGVFDTPAGAVFSTRSSVGADAGLDWSLITVVPEADFLANAKRTRSNTLMVGLAVVLLTLVLGYLVSRKISRPVIQLEGHLKQVGAGEFDQKIDLRGTQEFAHLSETVNQMSADLRERIELRRSLAMAMEVQQSLLPDTLPSVEGLQIAGTSNYCDQTGGDYYDFLSLSGNTDQTISIVVGDVMGHGIAAAMLMATARGILRSRCCEPGTTGELIGHLNEQLVQVTQGQRFMTMIMASVDASTRRVSWASAGHDMPFIYDPGRQAFIDLEGGGLPLGVMQEESYEEYVTEPLPPGTIIAFMTDGVFEARNKAEALYGKGRIKQILKANHAESAKTIAAKLEQDLDQFQAGTLQEDDITFVIVKLA